MSEATPEPGYTSPHDQEEEYEEGNEYKRLIVNLCLIAVSTIVVLTLGEMGLRMAGEISLDERTNNVEIASRGSFRPPTRERATPCQGPSPLRI